MQIDKEKQVILDHNGSALVIANPGTGKTFLLGLKYVDLLKKGHRPEDIVCLTFTQKAKQEMEKRIIDFIEEEELVFDFSKLNVFTFHSFAMEYLDDSNIVSSNLLRFVIYDYLKQKEVFNYPDDYLISEYVPKFENLMRYLKSYGITPDKISKKETIECLDDFEKSNGVIEKSDLVKLLDHFVNIFVEYEKAKASKGMDYADLLIKFLDLEKKPFFENVLVDELQDVNELEAKIAISVGKNYFAVGDPKQSIFGFQGGSITNFNLFKEKGAKEFKLNENRRSTQQILDFCAKDYFDKSVDENKDDVLKLVSLKNLQGEKPKIIEYAKDEVIGKVCAIINKEKNVAIITRTNFQILEIAKELENRKIDFATTYFASSLEAKENIIRFIKSIFSNNINDVKKAFFTPFFPIIMKDAFELSKNKNLTIEEVYSASPEFKKLREEQNDIETINDLFVEKIFPVCVSRGEDYLLAAEALIKSTREALMLFEGIDLETFILYLQSTDLLDSSNQKEASVVLTTVHKAKGLEFDNVVYVTKDPKKKGNFLDYLVECILKASQKNVKEELEEEKLRIDFVAYTRAKKQLFVLTDKAKNILNNKAELMEIEGEQTSKSYEEKQKQAYNLFINKEYEKAKELLEKDSSWLKKFVENHFNSLEHISFSRLNKKASDYLEESILKISQYSTALNVGSEAHNAIEAFLKNQDYEIKEEAKKYVENAKELIKIIQKEYPEFVNAEEKINLPLNKIIKTDDKIKYFGLIDAIFKNNENYLIVDWKTSKNTDGASNYRRQLELYKRTYSEQHNIPIDKIKTAIAFIGLRKIINDGEILTELDEKQPQARTFSTLQTHLEKFLEWRNKPQTFFEDLEKEKMDTPLVRAILEQYGKEK
jgi:DNA helicase II / ATP-dependent DNA helicase PcrA